MKHFYLFVVCIAVLMTVKAQQKIDPANYYTGDNATGLPQGGTGNTPEYSEVGPWYNGTSGNALGGNYRQTSQLGGEVISGRSATWTVAIPPAANGNYILYTYVLQAVNNSSSVFYLVKREFEANVADSIRHNQRRSAITQANVGVGAWVPLTILPLNTGNVFVTVGADSFSGTSIMRADGIRLVRSTASGADLEFGRRALNGFDSIRIGETWLDAPLGSITYQEFPLFNYGGQNLVIQEVTTTAKQNRWDVKIKGGGTFPLEITPGQKKTLLVGFRPFQEETINDTLVIHSNDSAEVQARVPISGVGINYNFILNAGINIEPHYNAPFDNLGDDRRPILTKIGTWSASGTGISAFPYPVLAGNTQGVFSPATDPAALLEYKFQLPDSVNGNPGSSGNYFVEYGPIPFSSNSDPQAQMWVIPAFSTDTVKSVFNQNNVSTPPFFYPIGNKPIYITQGEYTKVWFFRTPGVAPTGVLRGDLIRVRKIPTGPAFAADESIDFGNVSMYESDRQGANNFRLPVSIGSGGEAALRIDSIRITNPRYYSLINPPTFPLELAAVNGSHVLTVQFIPDTIRNNITSNLVIYSNDTTKSPYTVRITGNGIGTNMALEESDPAGSFIFPGSPVIFPDPASATKWQKDVTTAASGGSRYVGYIYSLEGDPSTSNKAAYIEYFPQLPTLSGHGPEIDTFNVYARMPVGSSISSPAVRYKIFPAAGGTPIEVVVNQNNRSSDRVFLGVTKFLRSDSRDVHGSGAIVGYIRVENDTALVNAYYKDSLVNRAKQDSFLIRADAIILQESLTDVEYEVNPNIPGSFHLSQNFPNPFNPQTHMKFDLPTAANVELTVFDILGREVRRLVNDFHNAGSYTVTWNGKNEYGRQVATGVYIYRLRAGSYVSTKKMLMMK